MARAVMPHLSNDVITTDGERAQIEPKLNGNVCHTHHDSEQQVIGKSRLLSTPERAILQAIDSCFKSWHTRWISTYMKDGREFKIVYDLMEGLLHYEHQITDNQTTLSDERTNAIARAVARLVDYGNSLLNLDLIIRSCDETSSELNPSSATTIELFHGHVKAHSLREKLLYDYFKKDKPNSIQDDNVSVSSGAITHTTLQVPNSQQPNQSPTMERSHRSSLGSSTSINTLSDGRRTPQPISSLLTQIELQTSTIDLNSHSVEIASMRAAIRGSAFTTSHSSATRLALLPGLLSKIEGFLLAPSTIEKITTCFELLDALLETIEKLPNESRAQEVTIIANSLLKPLVRILYIYDRDNIVEFQLAHWTTCLMSIIRLMTASDFNNYLRNFNNLTDLSSFLKDYLFVIKRLMSASNKSTPTLKSESIADYPPVYPSSWIEMILVSCSTFLKSLTSLYQIMRQYFGFNLQMWSNYIDCLVHFILQDTLNPDRYMLKEQQRLLAKGLRQTSAEYVRLSWNSLTYEQKQQLLDDLIDPLLRASMILRSRQRSILLPIFYDMMRCDYTSQYVTPRGSECSSSTLCSQGDQSYNNFTYEEGLESFAPIPAQASQVNPAQTSESLPYLSCNELISEDGTVLTKFTHLIVGKLNTLMNDLGFGDEMFQNEFCAAISGNLNLQQQNLNPPGSSDTSQFRSMAKHTSDLIAEFMQICLDARQANKLCYKHLHLLCLFKLILFFRDKVDRIELYLHNLYKLCYTHHVATRYVEAGYTLLELAKSLPISNKPLESDHRIVTRFFQTSQPLTDYLSLKIFLYNTIIEYFDQGQVWEAAVPLCRELIDIYQFKLYQYDKLAQILQKLSVFFNKITEPGQRNEPEYFRITFYGSGFPVTLRDTTMVYRGKAYEKLADFQATMLSKYPDAQLLNSLARPDDSLIEDPESRYLQINACAPVIDLKAKFGNDLAKVDEYILSYYRHNECDKFSFSRKIKRPNHLEMDPLYSNDSFANIWRERTILTTSTLPNMLPFFPVYLIESKVVSPIECAMEDLERANDRLSCMVNRFKADKRQAEDVRLLGQLLLGFVDAAVNGGITKYEEAFFTIKPARIAPSARAASSTNNSDNKLHLSTNPSGLEPIHGKQQADSAGNHYTKALDRTNEVQVDKLKCLIAGQVPLLDEAIRLHRDRVADVMRPQHDHLEAAYKDLKRHIMSKYSRYLPSDYNRSTMRSYRSLARSPNRYARSETRSGSNSIVNNSGPPVGLNLASRFAFKRMSDVGTSPANVERAANNDQCLTSCNIPYRQFSGERRSLPFLTDADPVFQRDQLSPLEAVAPASLRRAPPPPIDMGSHQEATSLNKRTSLSQPAATCDQIDRPIPAMHASVSMRDDRTVSCTDASRLSYTRLVCADDDDGRRDGQPASARKETVDSETEACLLMED